jgi:hypothetical protein
MRAEAEQLILGREASAPVTAESLAAARQKWEPVHKLLEAGYSLAEQRKWPEARDAYVRAWAESAFDWRIAEAASRDACLALFMATTFRLANDKANLERLCRFLLARHANAPSTDFAEIYTRAVL